MDFIKEVLACNAKIKIYVSFNAFQTCIDNYIATAIDAIAQTHKLLLLFY